MNRSVLEYMERRAKTVEERGVPTTTRPLSACCDEPDDCEDTLRAKAAELGLKPHHFAGKETIKKQISERKKEKAPCQPTPTEE